MTGNYVHEKLKDIACNILVFVENKIKEDLPRNDYQEFLRLIIIFLGGTPSYDIKFCLPDTYHLARQMEKQLIV